MPFCIYKTIPLINSQLACEALYPNETNLGFCPPEWDRFNCWPPTAPGANATHLCPAIIGHILEVMAYRICGEDGTWAQKGDIRTDPDIWSNYSQCRSSHVAKFLNRVTGVGPDADEVLMTKHKIGAWVRLLELICLILSTILGSWTTFLQWRHKDLSLTKEVLHIRLFSSTTIHSGLKLYVYLDQLVSKAYPECATLSDAGIFCQYAYVMSEFTKSLMISYMVCEGIHLQSLVDTTRFPKEVDIRIFDTMSFVFSIVTVGLWAIVAHITLSTAVCWWGYVFREEFWIVELPRILIILVNGVFLVKIVVGVVRKLRATNAPSGEQVKKGTKAAMVLMFLFGVPHLMPMIYSAADLSPIGFGIFSVVTTLFSASQGFCVALLYCREMILDSIKSFFKALKCNWTQNLCESKRRQRRNRIVIEQELKNNNQVHQVVQMNDQSAILSSASNSRRNLLETEGCVQSVSPELKPIHPIFECLRDGIGYSSTFNLSLDNVEIEHIEIPGEYLTKYWKPPADSKGYFTRSGCKKVVQTDVTFRRSSSFGGGIKLSSSNKKELYSHEPQPSTSTSSTGRCQSEQHVNSQEPEKTFEQFV